VNSIYAPSDIPIASRASNAPRSTSTVPASPLGIVPHQLRGYLADFNTLKITGQSYDRCTGCSQKIVMAYQEKGFEMLLAAFDDAKYLERLTGLDKLAEESEAAMANLDWDEEDEEEDTF
jgi:ubiquitin-like modifier-activating enzyme ATG7